MPADGTIVHSLPTLSWLPVQGASYYNVQIFLKTQRVLSRWPHDTSMPVPSGVLKPGKTYKWYVWPGFGPLAKASYGKLIGSATFTYQP